MKSLRKTPPQCDARLARRALRKVVASLVSAALFATVLFAVSVAVSQPAAGYVAGSWAGGFTLAPGGSRTVDVPATSSNAGRFPGQDWHVQCSVSVPSTSRFTVSINRCRVTVTAKTAASVGCENLAVSGREVRGHQGGGSRDFGTWRLCVRNSDITFNAPSPAPTIQAGGSLNLSMDTYASDSSPSTGGFTITCGTITEASALISLSDQQGCDVTVNAGSTTGTANISIPYTSSGGDTHTGTVTVRVITASNITFTAPSGLKVGTNRTQTINALDYATEANSDFTITCGDATNIDTTELQSVSRSGCVFTVTPKAVQGAASFTVPFTSSGGDTESGVFNIEVGPESTVAYTAPGTFNLGRNLTLAIDALSYVTEDPAYTVTCGDATGVDASKLAVTHTGSSCNFTIDPVDTLAPANQGDTTFTIPYTSDGGHSTTGMVTVNIGPDSNLSFTAPSTLTVGRNYTLVIDALDHVSENTGHTVTCADPTGVDATKMTVTRSTSGDGCSFTVDPVDTLTPANQGDTTFSVLFTTTGGTTTTGTFTINIGADSNIVLSDPGTLTVARNRTRTFVASSYATDGSFTFSCGDATGVDTTKMTVSHTGSSCDFTIDPVDTLMPADQGDTTFSVPFTSTGGATTTGTFTVNIGPDSTLAFTALPTLTVGRNYTLVIDALDQITETGVYTVTCADATGVDAVRMTVTRSTSGNGCSFTVDPENALAQAYQGDTTFSVEFTSTGSATVTGTFTINIGTDSIIAYTAPADLRIEAGSRTLEIDAGGFAADGSYALTCSDASALTGTLASVAHTGSSCTFTATTSSGTASGSASFTITYTSSGGDTRQAVVPVRVGPARNLVFTAPSALAIGAGGTLVFDVSSYATDGGFWGITCGDSTANTARIASVARVGDTCEFRVTAGSSLGAASFTVPYTSETGAMVSGVVPVVVGAAANIVFTAPVAGFPSGLNVEATKSIVIDASAYAADGSYAISCGDAESVSSLWQSVVRDSGGNGCSFTATARAGAGGTAGFTVPYASSRGGSADGVISVLIRPLSDIVFTAPPTTGAGSLSVLAGRVLVLDASSYAADGDYAISCGAIAESSALISLGTQSGCVVPITAVSGTGTAAISVPYTSSGGDTHTGTVSLSVSRAVSGTAIPLLSNAGCTDGTFVNLTTNPRVTGANNDLAEDCMALVAIQNHFAGFEANRDLAEFHAFREWGDASVEWGTGTASDRLVQNWIGITVTGGRVTDFVISATRSTVGGQFTIVSGTLPSEIQNLTALERLEADDHMLSGNIPSWLGSMSALNDVNLSDNNFSGPIPSELGNLSSLQFLSLHRNELSGSIPSQLGSLSNLRQLNLNSNQLTGSIPSQLGSLSSTAFTHLNLSGNRLSGSIPSQLTSLTALRNLLLDNNLLTGSIPSGIGSLTSLVTLDLEGNRLSGSVPAGVGSLSSLFRLDLSNNQFTGAIPAAVGNLVTLNPAGNRFTGVRQVYICGNYFTGALPTGLQQTASSQYVLQDYPIAEGFNPVACQDAMAVPASGDIVFAPPVVVPVQAGGESVYVNAASYFTGSDYAATCADATGPAIDDSKLTITRSGCSYNVTAPAPSPVSRAFENVTFNVPYTQVSAGAAQVNGVVTVRILPASSIAFNAPSNLFVSASSTVVVDASGAASDGPYAISCGDATGVDSTKFSSVVRSTSGNGCMFTIASTASTGDGTFTVPFSSSGGATGTGTFTVNVNNIVYTAPTDLSVVAGRSIEITASSYVTDGANTFTCADATGIDSAKITSVVQVTPPGGCVFRVTTAAAAAGESVVITVPVTSSGGATRSIVIPMSVTPVSDIVFTAPAAVKIGAGNTKTIDVGAYAADGSYTVSCGFQQSTRHARLASVAVSGCRFTLAAGSAQGAATLVVDYTSTGGDTQSGTVNLSIGPPSSVSFTAPPVPAVGRNRTLVINALDYVRENTAYAVSCSDAFDISTLPNIGFGLIRYRMSVARSTSGDGCAFTVDPLNTLPSNRWGNAIFRVVFTSEGGSSTTGTFTVNIRGDVAILFTDPGALAVPRNRILRIDATDHVEDGANTITCADATGFDSDKMAVTRRGCVYTVNPVNSLADSLLGETTFSAMFRSSGGSSTTGTFTVDIGPDTNIRTTNIPGTLFFTNSVKVNLSRFATDGDYEIFCTSVSATAGTISNRAANSCVFDYSPSFLGRFNVSFRSAGGSTTTASINVAQSLGTYLRSFSFPAQSVAAGRTIEIEASRHISLSTANTYFCFEPTNVDGKITVVLRGCRYIITAGSRQGAASFNVNFSITSGEVRSAAVAVNVGPASDITFNAPAGLQVGRNRTLAIDATDYATDSSYTITCGDAAGVDSTKLTSVSRNGCVFTVDPINSLAAGSQGDTSFTVPFTSSGGDTATGAFTVNIGPDSTITYTAPGALEIGRNFTFEIDASDYVEEISGSGYTIACSDAAGVDANRMAVTRTANTCEYTVAPVGNSEANAADRLAPALQGDTTFAITFASTGGHIITRTITVNIGPDSVPMFTAPATNPAVGASLTRAVDVSSYATDGNYTISCGTITETDADITLGTQTGCSVLITSVATTPQTADITIPYTSSGGGSTTGTLTLDVGVASNIVFNAPTGLKVGINRTQTIDASDYAADGGNTISCGTATNVDTARLASVVRDSSGNGCGFTITPISTLTPAQQGTANFTVPYTSSGGDTESGVIPIEVGPASNIVYASPGTLSVARNLTLEIDASGYAADGSYTISCGDATGVTSTRLAVTHTGSSCDFTIDPVDALAPNLQGDTTFTIPFTSDGGATATGTVTVNIGPDSALTFTAPGTFTLGRNRTLVIDALDAISGENAAYTVSCADATGVDATRMTVTRSSSGDGCSFTVDPVDTLVVGSQGDTTFSVAFSSTGGATATGTFTVNIGPDSTITANIPPATGAGRLQVARNLTLEIDASDYVSETSGSGYTISCSDARSIHSRLSSVSRTANTCDYTIDPVNSATSGTATFVVTFTSTGGHSIVRTITVNVGANSAITFTAPPTSGANRLLVGRNRSLVVDAGSYARETSGSGYTISCGDAVSIDTARLASVTHTGSSCSFTVTPVSSLSSSLQATNATFTVPYASSGGATADGIISVKVGPDSTITFNAPTLARGSNLRTFTIDASDYVAETSGSGYTISCGTATSVDTTEITSVTRLSNSCRYRIVLNGTQGSTGFTVPYTSTGGHAISRAVQITVGAASAIVFSAPASNPAVAASRTLTLDVGSYAADGSYTITCGTITESSALISLGSQTQGSCSIEVTAGTSTGTAAISVPYISSGGATLTRSITIDVGGASNISFTAPSDLKVGINRTQTINALDYASDSGYTITCGTATSIDSTRLTSVVRDASGNGCGYTITPISTLTQSQQGAASFTVPLTSDGGDTENAVFSIAVGPASTITFTAPSALLVPKNRTLVVDAAPYAVEANPSNYAISCGDATSIDTVELQSVTRTANTCTFTITPKNVAGSASFTVPYTSEGGHSVDGVIPVTVGTDSTITYTSPGTLTVGRNRTLTIDASGYVEEIASSGHTITCSDAAGVDNTKLTSVTRTANTCSFTITPITTLTPALQGDTTFSITFTSSGGHSITRTITVNVGPDSTIVFTPPASNPAIAASRTRTIDVSSYAADGSYTISCGAITESSALISLGSQNGCSIPVTSGSSMGTATISIPYRSSGGHTLTSSLSIDVGAASSIVFNAPTGLKVGTNRTQRIDALDYASDGGYTITCGTATNTGANVPTSGTVALASVVRDASGNGCGYTITPTSTQGTATFTIPYTSAGGDTSSENISITVGPPSTIVYSSPGTLRVGRNQTLEIDASGYVSDNSAYTITCADATGVVATRMAVTRTANSCTFTIDPVDALTPANQGTTTFTIPFTSDGGHSITRTISVNIGPDSNLTFTAPSTFTLGRNRTLVIDALAAISGENAAYTVSCADATGVDANKMTVTRSSSGNGCSFTVDPVDTLATGSQGDATFSVPYTSTGGATASGTFTVNIGPDSTITANIPPATGANRLLVARNLTLEIDASDYVTEASNTYTISCSDARSIHSRLTSVARTANTCRYTIDPNNFAFPGAATFVVTFTSTGGHSIDRTITVNVGANSQITFTPPPTTGANRLLVGRNRALVVNAGSYARETSGSGYTISCGDATSIDSTRLASVTHSGSSCSFTVTPVSSLSSTLQATNATFTVPYSSTGGAAATGTISVKVGPDSTITYNAPTLERGNNLRTFTIDASDYVSETSGSGYTISCGTATSVDTTEITSVTRLSNSCRYRIVLNGTQGTTGFTVPYTSTGGHSISRAVQITVGAASSIVFSAPSSNPAVAASRTLTLDVSSYAADGSYTISCGTITEFSALISLGSQTGCSIPITAATSTGTAFISVPYISSGGATTTRSISIDVGVASDIQFTAPSNLKVGINRTQTINALDYATDSGYTITCGTATSIDTTKLTSVARDSSGNGCGYTITPISTLTQSQQGSASFTVPLTSDGGDTENAVFSITVGPASTITFTPPSPALSVAKNRTITVDVSGYAVEANPTNYAISCGDATSIDTVELQSVTHTGRSCTFTINPKNVAGSASFTVPYTSEGGHSVAGAISVTVGPDSNIVYTPPTGLRVARNRTLEIDATDHFTESSTYTVTCGDATGIDNTRLTSVARTANTCTFTVDPVDTLAAGLQGNTTFTVPLSSTGGHARNALFTVNVGPDSNIVFAAPTGLKVGRNRTLAINALAAVTENPAYTVTCADATGVSANRMTVTRSSTGSRCVFTVDPVDTLATGLQGNTTFAVAFTSTGGATASGTFTVNIGPDSTISYNAPTGLLVGRNRTLTIDASGYVSESDSNNTITCGDATAIHSRLTSVARTANSCSYTIDPNNFATVGTATFAIAFTSDGGHTRTETISVEVGPDSNIRFNAPPTSGPNRLRIGRNLTLAIDALDYVNENAAYTVTCGDATGVDAARLTVTHTGSSCDFTIDPVDTLAQSLQGNTSFTIPYTSDGGATATGRITVNIGPDSAITFTAPTGLKIGRNRTLVIDALAAVSGENAAYTVSCADATGVDANRMTVTRSSSGNRCSFTVDPVDTLAVGSQGDTTFAVAFSSTGGATASGTFTVNIGPDSAIVYTAPAGLLVGRNRTLSVDLSSAATDGSYTVTCGDATNVHSRFSSVTRPDAQASPCVFAATPRTTASLGTATFRVPFTSDGGAASAGTVSIAISQPSTIVFTAPDPALKIGINRTRTIDALDYARDGNYTITCLDATGVDSTKLTSVARDSSGNGCGYTINPISSLTQSQQGDATFTVPYRSAGGHVLNQVFTITVGPASTIVYTAPVGANALTVGHNRALTIDASSYAADGSYAISCGDARSIHARIDHITRNGCSFTITPVSGMTGAATFTIPYSSDGGHTRDGQVSVTIGAASNIVYSAPSGIVIPVSTARTIDVGSYASDGSYTISCGDATGVNASRLASVTHTGSSCSFEITAAANQGATSFVVPYRSAGGATLSGTISLSVGPASSIVFTAPSGLDVHVGQTLAIHANDYASDGPYTLQCADATNRSASLTSVVRTANTCDFTITPGSSTGTGTFNVPYTSSGGATHTGTISVNISPQSTIAFTAPTGLSVAAGRSVTVDASTAADTGYTVSCGDATAVNPRIASVSRTGCSYVVRAGSIAGSASFTIPFTSTGGATLNAQIAITIGPRSSIAFAAPTGLSVQIGSTLTIDASDYAADSAYTITCGDATGVPSVFASVARTANTCSFVVTPGASTGSGSFTVPYSSSGGATRNGSITVAVTPESSIVFAPPPISGPDRLRIGAGNTRTINLASYATDGPYSITCGNATAAEPAKLTDIHRNGCRYTITAAAAAAQGNTTFSLTYTSSGGNTSNASFTINIGPASNIVYTAPADITLQANSARGIDLSSYATDGTGNDAYTIACLDATDIDPEISSVTRNGCVYTIRAGSTPGDADFHITYTSTGGDTHLATVHITITPAPVEPEERPAGPIQPIDPPARRPTPPPPTTTTTTTIPDPSRPTTTLEPDQPGPRWNTLTAQQGGTTPGQIRQAFNLGSTQTIYTWNTARQTWTRATRSSQAIPAGTRVSFRTEEAVTNREMRTSNLGGGTTRMRLTAGWSTLSIPQGITRTDDTDFLLDPSLTDCRNQQGIIAIASYSTRSRRWSISLPCHPTAQRRLTTGQNAPYRPLMSIAPADTTYIFTRTRQPLTIRWNDDTQTYQVFQSIFTR